MATPFGDSKHTRILTGEITTLGANVHDLLGSEIHLREARLRAVARSMDPQEMEKLVRRAVTSVSEEAAAVKSRLENLGSDEANLEAKLEKKRTDLERNHNRLQRLKATPPPFIAEVESLEGELQLLYTVYLQHFRNLHHLEQLLEQLEMQDAERREDVIRSAKAAKVEVDLSEHSDGSDVDSVGTGSGLQMDRGGEGGSEGSLSDTNSEGSQGLEDDQSDNDF